MTLSSATEERTLEALARVPLFARLDDKQRRRLSRLCTPRSFAAGDEIYEEGAVALSLFIITSGQVQLTKKSGDTVVALETASAGGVLGHLALIGDRPRASTAKALEPTECLMLTRDSFDTLVKKDPEIAWCLTPALADRVSELQRLAVEAKLAQQTAEPAEAGAEAAAAAAEPAARPKPADEDEPRAGAAKDDDGDGDADGESDVGAAVLKMMRIQYGVMAGTAKGMTEMARAMERFLDSMAEETDLETSDDWGELFQKMPEAMAAATREALDEAGKAPKEMMDAFRRYSDGKD